MSDVGAELAFVLPFEDLAIFPKLFRLLDEKLPELGLTSYGVGVTTLEDVFLKVILHFTLISLGFVSVS